MERSSVNETIQNDTRPLHRLRESAGVLGFTRGLSQPSLVTKLFSGPAPSDEAIRMVDQFVRGHFGDIKELPGREAIDVQVAHVLEWTRAILEKNGHVVFEDARVWKDAGDEPNIWSVAQPCGEFKACIATIDFAGALLHHAGDPKHKAHLPVFDALLKKFSKVLKDGVIQGFNTFHFLQAARDLNIPWSRLSPVHIQFGMGASSRILDSSFTDRTSQIGTNLARNKVVGASVLRGMSLPVARHKLANSADEAVRIADNLGYPVVIKPADLDGGVGVAAYLLDAEAVRRAFTHALTCSKSILVEKHFMGRDYRIQLVNGELLGILERQPGGVVGDGQHTVRELVERQNHERATAKDDRRHLHAIKFDNDAEALLSHAGLSWASVPGPGQFVRLRGAANVASGGIPIPIPREAAHPDNLDLAIRAARAFRLDVAGVDLLVPDIGKSWLSSGAIICEVNAQPQMFTTMHKPMLQSLFGGTEGRIPITLILSAGPGETVSTALHDRLQTVLPDAGLANSRDCRIGSKPLSRAPLSTYQGGCALIRDPAVQAIIQSTCSDSAGSSWPFDRIDMLVLAGDVQKDTEESEATLSRLAQSACWLRPRHVLVDGSSSACVAAMQYLSDEFSCEVVGKGESPARAAELLAEATFALLQAESTPVKQTASTKKRKAVAA